MTATLNLKLTHPLVVLDLETTGNWVEKDRIIEIAMIRLAPDGQEQRFQSYVNPGMPVPRKIQEMTGITEETVRSAPPFKQIAPNVLAFIGEADLSGFNVERFDLKILERELFSAGFKFDWRTRTIYDAQKIYHRNERRDLKAAYQFYCAKELKNGHTAMGDTEATLEILAAQLERYGDPAQGVASLREPESKEPSEFFDEEKKFQWWNGQLYPAFGKYARKSPLKEIARKEPDYLRWMLRSDFPEQVKAMIRGVLEGRFPEPPA